MAKKRAQQKTQWTCYFLFGELPVIIITIIVISAIRITR